MECVLELAGAFSSKVWLVHVVPHSGPGPFNIDSTVLRKEVATELHHEHEFLQRLAQCVRDRGVDATALMTEGATVATLLKESQRLAIDLIASGCHKQSVLYAALLNCVEERLLSKCPCPTLFVPDPRGEG